MDEDLTEVVGDSAFKEILGVHLAGAGADEVIDIMHAHPTRSEGSFHGSHCYCARALHAPTLEVLAGETKRM